MEKSKFALQMDDLLIEHHLQVSRNDLTYIVPSESMMLTECFCEVTLFVFVYT